MDVIGQVTRAVVKSHHHGELWHAFDGLAELRGSSTSGMICPVGVQQILECIGRVRLNY